MKKIICFLLFSIFSINLVANCKIAEPNYDDIITDDAKYEYKEPIKRGKWVKPLAWLGYVGTCFLVPFPIVMDQKDNVIAINNRKYNNYVRLRENFKNEIEQCNKVCKNEKDLYFCYANVKKMYIDLTNNQENQYYKEVQILQQQQVIQQNQQMIYQMSRPKYTNSTTTKYGNTYHTNSYSY